VALAIEVFLLVEQHNGFCCRTGQCRSIISLWGSEKQKVAEAIPSPDRQASRPVVDSYIDAISEVYRGPTSLCGYDYGTT
jgi:hypothetical protein